MPQANPVGGLSLIVHILINIVCFLYIKILSIFRLSSNNPLSRFFEWLNSEKGETHARKYLSYVVLFSMIAFITLNIVLVSTTQYSLGRNDSIELFQYAKNSLSNIYQKRTPVETQNTTVMQTTYGNVDLGLVIDTSSVSSKIMSSTDTYLVEFMNDLGIADTSFENRARIAKDLNVVNNTEEYIGTLTQNKEIIARLKSGVITLLESYK